MDNASVVRNSNSSGSVGSGAASINNVDNYVRNKIAEVLADSDATNVVRSHNDSAEQGSWNDKSRVYNNDNGDREWAQSRAGSYLPNTHLAKTTSSTGKTTIPAGLSHGHQDVDGRQRSPRGSTEEPHSSHSTGSGISPRSIHHHRGSDSRDYHNPRSFISAGIHRIPIFPPGL